MEQIPPPPALPPGTDSEKSHTKPQRLALTAPQIAVGAVLTQDVMMQELLYMTEQLCDALRLTTSYRALLDSENHLRADAPTAEYYRTHYRLVTALCARAEELIHLTKLI